MPERDYLKELWYNRPWRYIPAVIRWMKWYPPKRLKAKGKFSYRKWLRNCFYINWQVAFKHTDKPVYDRCPDCLCFKCTNKKCKKKECAMCDKMSRRSSTYGMTTVTCGRAHIVERTGDA